MSKISASLVSELRAITNAPILDCKKALEKVGGDIQAAIEEMRKSGQAKADKKSLRTTAEGGIYVASGSGVGALIEVNCETDFVGRNEDFVKFATHLATRVLETQETDIVKFSALPFESNSQETVEQTRQALINKLGENIQIRRVAYFETPGILGVYIHNHRIGVLVEVQKTSDEQLAKDLAMQIAASSPSVVSATDVPQDLIEKEREIFMAQAQQSGKPEEIIKKMVEGRVQKFLEETSLLGQPFVKDPSVSVGALLKNAGGEVVRFVRYEVGEGVEKEQKDFAAEVMSYVK